MSESTGKMRATVKIEGAVLNGEPQEPLEITVEADSIKALKHQIHLISFRDLYGENAEALRMWKIENEIPVERAKKR